ncbi:nuclear mitotic apparatus protein 1-like [Bacillus rossius redtenbacheri]|uniref:nuclear mitotic apparatus protein 1-like n=1 Tax=Bacillus rossius redtenbacheri TaxID=93214 RepID=UPI002FDDC9F3
MAETGQDPLAAVQQEADRVQAALQQRRQQLQEGVEPEAVLQELDSVQKVADTIAGLLGLQAAAAQSQPGDPARRERLRATIQGLQEDMERVSQQNRVLKEEIQRTMRESGAQFQPCPGASQGGAGQTVDACFCPVTSNDCRPQQQCKPAERNMTKQKLQMDTACFRAPEPRRPAPTTCGCSRTAGQAMGQGTAQAVDVCLCSAANYGCRLEKELKQAERNLKKLQEDTACLKVPEPRRPPAPAAHDCSQVAAQAACVSKKQRELQEELCMLRQCFERKMEEVSRLMAENRMLREDIMRSEEDRTQVEAQLCAAQKKLENLENKMGKQPAREKESSLMEAIAQRDRADLLLKQAVETIKNQTVQLAELKRKYLDSQRALEEHRQTVQSLKRDNKLTQEDYGTRLCRIKSEYQQELQVLASKASALEKVRASLKEATNERTTLRNKCSELTRQLDISEKRVAYLVSQLDSMLRKRSQNGPSEAGDTESLLSRTKQENEELKKLVVALQNELMAKSQDLVAASARAQQLADNLTTLREECARQVVAVRQEAETTKRLLHCKVLEAEAAVERTRAAAAAVRRDRDCQHRHLQGQLKCITKSFSVAQHKIEELQGSVEPGESPRSTLQAPPRPCITATCPNLLPRGRAPPAQACDQSNCCYPPSRASNLSVQSRNTSCSHRYGQ